MEDPTNLEAGHTLLETDATPQLEFFGSARKESAEAMVGVLEGVCGCTGHLPDM